MWSPYHAIYWTIIGLFQNTPHQAIVEHNFRFIASKNLVIVNKVLGPNGNLEQRQKCSFGIRIENIDKHKKNTILKITLQIFQKSARDRVSG